MGLFSSMFRLVTLPAFCLFSVSLLATGALSEVEKKNVQKPKMAADVILLSIDKSTLRAQLQTWPEPPAEPRILKRFQIAIGKAEGDKQVEGDNKTPEGIYFARPHIDGRRLPEKYGARAIPIDFPNPIDRDDGKTGHGIWLHGVDDANRIDEAKVTEGCVAFYNDDVMKLASWMKPYHGIVLIGKDSEDVNNEMDVEEVGEALNAWMEAWKSRKIDDYIAFYDPRFHYKHYTKKTYKTYKNKIYSMYKKMELKFYTSRILTHPKYAVTVFNQDFNGDNRFISNGRKILYWEKNEDDKWLIRREVFEKRHMELVTYSDSELEALAADTKTSKKEVSSPNL